MSAGTRGPSHEGTKVFEIGEPCQTVLILKEGQVFWDGLCSFMCCRPQVMLQISIGLRGRIDNCRHEQACSHD